MICNRLKLKKKTKQKIALAEYLSDIKIKVNEDIYNIEHDDTIKVSSFTWYHGKRLWPRVVFMNSHSQKSTARVQRDVTILRHLCVEGHFTKRDNEQTAFTAVCNNN